MKQFKLAEFCVNVSAISVCTIVCLITLNVLDLIKSYFLVGGLQVIGMIVHTWKGWFMQKNGSRRIYHIISAVLVSIALLGFAIPPFLLIYYVLLFISPVLAIHYTMMCRSELNEIKKRRMLALR